MSDSINDLQSRWGIAGRVRIEAGEGGMANIIVTTPQAQVRVYLHGAHVTHFQPKGEEPVLFMSGSSLFRPDKPIRGGVPICFPWFGPRSGDAKAPAHGFARLRDWTIEAIRQKADGTVSIGLILGTSDETLSLWPYDFVARHTIDVACRLGMQLEVRNVGERPFIFEEALHSYLSVGDVRKVSIRGLSGVEYLDKMQHGARLREGEAPMAITAETDRVYLNTAASCAVDDPTLYRRLTIDKSGSGSTVVWNPWIAKAQAMADFGDDEWPAMLCIETCNVAENAVRLEPGAMHVMSATIGSQLLH